MKAKILAGVLIALSMVFSGCEKDQDGSSAGSIAFRMTDAGDPTVANANDEAAARTTSAIDVEILSVRVHMRNGPWISLPTRSGKYDLTRLTHGRDTMIVHPVRLPPGEIDRVQMVLGGNNWITVDGRSYPLQLTGDRAILVKMPDHITIPANQTRTVMLDFDAEHSIKQQSHSVYHFEPVIRQAH